ncbi:MAG: 3-phosphoshikimate 1-carboxyvinyltransferase, partial [Firmicutes bacterium]|nr:3-phosphoshikimate 1-carboxyvinyltransferase [Bacillota bacterium]
MELIIEPAPLRGTIEAVPSKSAAHRLLILAALADAPTQISPAQGSADTRRTLACLQALGAGFESRRGAVLVTPVDAPNPAPLLDCGESGSTLRFLLPVAAALGMGGRFHGGGRLPERPLGDLVDAMRKQGVSFSREKLPLEITGRLKPGEFALPGSVSSQYFTGLLLALPRLPGDSVIRIHGELESSAYVEMTLAALRRFGVNVFRSGDSFRIPGGQKYSSPGEVKVEGDWSSAAFFLAAGALGGPVTVTGLDAASLQGDRAIVPILKRFGAFVEISGERVTASGGKMRGGDIDFREIPDLLPVLAAVAASAEGVSRFTGGARLRFKESDRIASTAALLRSLGGGAEELSDGL